MASIDRRKFLQQTAVISACALCGSAAAFLAGCESEQKNSPDKKTDIDISSDAALQIIGGSVKKKVDGINGGNTILITRTSEKEFIVLAAQCTHKNVEVKLPKNGIIKCPAHGSRFKTDGSLVEGEAQKPLQKIVSSFNAGKKILTIG